MAAVSGSYGGQFRRCMGSDKQQKHTLGSRRLARRVPDGGNCSRALLQRLDFWQMTTLNVQQTWSCWGTFTPPNRSGYCKVAFGQYGARAHRNDEVKATPLSKSVPRTVETPHVFAERNARRYMRRAGLECACATHDQEELPARVPARALACVTSVSGTLQD
ncbi:hypothetical protein OF83DRAFT_1085699 [Amylostereum chailletii]|nr:hypothetical protein OF83DRAFT_1085699 [Amylostereum chailletii]